MSFANRHRLLLKMTELDEARRQTNTVQAQLTTQLARVASLEAENLDLRRRLNAAPRLSALEEENQRLTAELKEAERRRLEALAAAATPVSPPAPIELAPTKAKKAASGKAKKAPPTA